MKKRNFKEERYRKVKKKVLLKKIEERKERICLIIHLRYVVNVVTNITILVKMIGSALNKLNVLLSLFYAYLSSN